MEFIKNIVFFICVLILKASCHEDDHIYSHMDLNTDVSKEHLRKELHGKIEKTPEMMKFREIQFHYFNEHDTDKDNRLDGNEITELLLHHNAAKLSEENLMNIVNNMLNQKDKDDDGFLSFAEYAARTL